MNFFKNFQDWCTVVQLWLPFSGISFHNMIEYIFSYLKCTYRYIYSIVWIGFSVTEFLKKPRLTHITCQVFVDTFSGNTPNLPTYVLNLPSKENYSHKEILSDFKATLTFVIFSFVRQIISRTMVRIRMILSNHI